MNYEINYKSLNLLKIGRNFFYLGIFLLPSAFAFSAIFLLISIILSTLNSRNFLKNRWNLSFFSVAFLMFISSLIASFSLFTPQNSSLVLNPDWLDLLNWIPLIWAFASFQIYLNSKKNREICAGLLLAGSVPILVSGFAQYFFGWYGPLEAFNGIIIWYQKSIETRGYNALTGPFNNQNYAGAWLVTIFPICFFQFRKNLHEKKYKRIISFLFMLTLFIAIFLTCSRNAIIALMLSIPIMLGAGLKIWVFGLIFFICLIMTIYVFEFPLNILRPLRKSKILESFIPNYNPKFKDILSFTRINIWSNSISYIMQRPIFGWGASTFSVIYIINNKDSIILHTHNLVLEVTHNYGIITALILFTSIFQLMRKSSKKIFSSHNILNKNLSSEDIDKYWWTSSFLILFIHLSDITYYDGRISILFWLLLSGLIMIIREKN